MKITVVLNNFGIEGLDKNTREKLGTKIYSVFHDSYGKWNKEVFKEKKVEYAYNNNNGVEKFIEFMTPEFQYDENKDKTEIQETIIKKLRMVIEDLKNPFIGKDFEIRLGMLAKNNTESPKNKIEEFDYEQKALMYTATEPKYAFDQVILSDKVLNDIEEALSILECEKTVFDDWGLRCIEPSPSTSLSFYGPPGTGKTMAAEAIANKLGKKILRVSYADIESKYVGEGPKMVKAIFMAAERDNAVLFIDESDSMLSKRLQNTSNGSDQSINSMRSQLLISLEHFSGIVIFATNLVVNYDKAFLSRLISIKFDKPGAEEREKIWKVHIYPSENHKINIPLADDVNVNELAEKYEFVGREIKKAVISACIKAVRNKQDKVYQHDFTEACEKIQLEMKQLREADDYTKIKQDNNLKEVLQKQAEKAEQVKITDKN